MEKKYIVVLLLFFIFLGGWLYQTQVFRQWFGHRATFVSKPATKIVGIGVIGDSQSDEYRADDNRGGYYADTTLNWVELLAKYRHLNFGTWSDREEPRRTGYAYNWARSGATTESLLANGQHDGLAQQIKNKEVNVVVIYIGANDFAPYGGYNDIYYGLLSDAQLQQKVDTIVSNISTAVNTLQSSGRVHILLVTDPDWGNNLALHVAFSDDSKRAKVTSAIISTNSKLSQMAKAKGIATADPNTFYGQISQNSNPLFLQVGDVSINKLFPGDDPHDLFLSDGIHPGTVLNGLFANFIIENLNKNFGTTIEPFSEKEILQNAGISE